MGPVRLPSDWLTGSWLDLLPENYRFSTASSLLRHPRLSGSLMYAYYHVNMLQQPRSLLSVILPSLDLFHHRCLNQFKETFPPCLQNDASCTIFVRTQVVALVPHDHIASTSSLLYTRWRLNLECLSMELGS